MILAIDVDYREDNKAVVSGVLFEDWKNQYPQDIVTTSVDNVQAYKSGQFYKRELPCILELLKKIDSNFQYIIVDGYVFLGEDKKGLGAYLYEALDKRVPIIGVAKNAFRDIEEETYIYRGESKKPLYITSIGLVQENAKEYIQQMHGKYRLPTLLKLVDSSCRA